MNAELLRRVERLDLAAQDGFMPEGVWSAEEAFEELCRRVDATGKQRLEPGRASRSVSVALAAAVIALLLIGVPILLAQLSSDLSPTDQPPVVEPHGMGDPGSWSWTRVEDQTAWLRNDREYLLLGDGRQLYRTSRLDAGSIEVVSSGDGVTWQSVARVSAPTGYSFANWSDPATPDSVIAAAADGRLIVPWTSIVRAGPTPHDPVLVTVVKADGTTHTGTLFAEMPQGFSGYAALHVGAAAVGSRGALVVTVMNLDADALGRVAFGDELIDRRGNELFVEIRDGVVALEPGDRTVPLTDLGLDEEGFDHAVRFWMSPDGEAWRTVATPPFIDPAAAAADIDTIPQIVGIDNGFVALGDDGGAWFSENGADWRIVGSPSGLDTYHTVLAPWRGQALLFDPDSFWRVTSDGVSPLPVSSAPGIPGLQDIVAGDAGIAYVDLDGGEIVYSADGHEWSRAPLPAPIVVEIEACVGWCAPEVWVGQDTVFVRASNVWAARGRHEP